MKWLGIALLCIGVAVAAAYGSRLSPSMHAELTAKGRAQLLQAAEAEALSDYCAAREQASLPAADGCPDGDAPQAEPQGDMEPPPSTLEERVAAGRARVSALREADTTALPPAVREARGAWLDATEAAVEPSAAAAVLRPAPPDQRLREWAAANGLPFGAGLLLVVIGAIVGRIAIKREALAQSSAEGESEGVADLGQALGGLRERALELAAETNSARADADRLKEAVHDLAARFEPIVGARTRVQARYGMAGFAEIFGPFSSAERDVNRAWSALVDGHWGETHDSLTRAAASLEDARSVLDALAKKPA